MMISCEKECDKCLYERSEAISGVFSRHCERSEAILTLCSKKIDASVLTDFLAMTLHLFRFCERSEAISGIFSRHCERSEAISIPCSKKIAASVLSDFLAMTINFFRLCERRYTPERHCERSEAISGVFSRHCERSEAISISCNQKIAASVLADFLAMTINFFRLCERRYTPERHCERSEAIFNVLSVLNRGRK